MSTGTVQIKRAATTTQPSRTKGKVESPLESLLIAVLRKGLPAELSAFGAHLAPKDIDVVVSKMARQFGREVGQTSALKAFDKLMPPEEK
jgi:hypothetical protein